MLIIILVLRVDFFLVVVRFLSLPRPVLRFGSSRQRYLFSFIILLLVMELNKPSITLIVKFGSSYSLSQTYVGQKMQHPPEEKLRGRARASARRSVTGECVSLTLFLVYWSVSLILFLS